MTMMDHPDDGRLQAFLDFELPTDAREGVERHLLICDECRERAQDLRGDAELIADALATLDPMREADLEAARWEIRRRRAKERAESRRRRLAAAAVVVLFLGAGAAAAMPGSPIRSWLATADTPQEEVATRAADAEAGLTVQLLDGRARVEIAELHPGLDLEVRVGSGEGLDVEVPATTAFRTGRGWVEVSDAPSRGRLRIEVPMGAREVGISIGGNLRAEYAGGRLRIDGREVEAARPVPGETRTREEGWVRIPPAPSADPSTGADR